MVAGGPAPHQAPRPTAETMSLPSAPTPETYTVVAGDTLTSIGGGLSRTWEQLAAYNALADPNFLLPGEVLKVPAASYHGVVAALTVQRKFIPPVNSETTYQAPAPALSGSCWGLNLGDPNVRTVISAEDSTCDPYARNPRSGACGLGQLIGGCDTYNGYAQAQEMTSYVMGRYGSWAAAAAHERAYGWY